MQSLEVTRQLCEIDRDLLRERLKSMLSQMDRGDIEGMLQHFAPDIVCFPRNSWGQFIGTVPTSMRLAVKATIPLLAADRETFKPFAEAGLDSLTLNVDLAGAWAEKSLDRAHEAARFC